MLSQDVIRLLTNCCLTDGVVADFVKTSLIPVVAQFRKKYPVSVSTIFDADFRASLCIPHVANLSDLDESDTFFGSIPTQ